MTIWDAEADGLLQELYGYATPGPHSTRPGHPLELDAEPGRVRRLVEACGLSYERDSISLISDREYDRLAQWLGDTAATAMDWQRYPDASKELASRLQASQAWREEAIVCFECWQWEPRRCCCGQQPCGAEDPLSSAQCVERIGHIGDHVAHDKLLGSIHWPR